MEVEGHQATLDEPVGVPVEVVVHHEACLEIGATHEPRHGQTAVRGPYVAC